MHKCIDGSQMHTGQALYIDAVLEREKMVKNPFKARTLSDRS